MTGMSGVRSRAARPWRVDEWVICAAVLIGLVLSRPALSQTHHSHAAPKDSAAAHEQLHHMPGHEMSGMHGHGAGMVHPHDMHMSMNGMYGPYPLTREASGTAWQPDAASHRAIHEMRGEWMVMLHGLADIVFDHQGGPRGDEEFFSDNMGMVMALRPLGSGTLGLRGMASLEPASIGKEGYPLLLQTGETADGVTPLIDRQHPHDLFIELAGAYSVAFGDRSLFVYGGLPGEPALGPPVYMHRFSGLNIPVAPIGHHWLDATHISYGVVTAGVVLDRIKLEASAFRGREPDQDRWNIESPKLDSYSYRLSFNPTERWALQASFGRLKSPEQLEPDVDQDRTTASAMVDGTLGSSGRWEGSLAWGENRNRPGHTLDAFTAEATAEVRERHTIFARAEHVEKDELFVAPAPEAGQVFDVGELTLGYRYDFLRQEHASLGIGAAGTLSQVPRELHDDYGDTPVSGLVFLRAALR